MAIDLLTVALAGGTGLQGLLDRSGEPSVPGMSCADVVLQAGQSAQHVVLGLDGRVADTGAAAHAQLKLTKP